METKYVKTRQGSARQLTGLCLPLWGPKERYYLPKPKPNQITMTAPVECRPGGTGDKLHPPGEKGQTLYYSLRIFMQARMELIYVKLSKIGNSCILKHLLW